LQLINKERAMKRKIGPHYDLIICDDLDEVVTEEESNRRRKAAEFCMNNTLPKNRKSNDTGSHN